VLWTVYQQYKFMWLKVDCWQSREAGVSPFICVCKARTYASCRVGDTSSLSSRVESAEQATSRVESAEQATSRVESAEQANGQTLCTEHVTGIDSRCN
jgi:hypothetical protein